MREQLEQRLQELKAEFESGQSILRDLETRQANVKSSLLRISGAIQVLEEMLQKKTESETGESETQELQQSTTV
jgi:hypothetical protein